MVEAVRIPRHGGPDVLTLEEIGVGAPGPGEVRLRHTAIGVNMSDVYRRRGDVPTPLPATIGIEGAGVIEALGEDVAGFSVGDRVVYWGPPGSYSRARLISADDLVLLPDAIDDRQAACVYLKGLTVHYLIHWTYAVRPGDIVLIHAAAGALGLIFCQWAKHLGATVIGTVSTDEKAAIAAAHGCTHTINYQREDFVARVGEITDGRRCAAVYDTVGWDTILGSLQCVARRGTLAACGRSSGPLPELNTDLLRNGSIYFTRPTLADFVATREELETSAQRLFCRSIRAPASELTLISRVQKFVSISLATVLRQKRSK